MEPRSKEQLKQTAEEATENVQEATEAARNRLNELWDVGKERATEYAKVTDQKIRENPYQTIGIAFGIGLLIGVLINRGGRSED
jgi:ElaB/YqjD/DUF883 family membrane-anchored ribosome-binding protein